MRSSFSIKRSSEQSIFDFALSFIRAQGGPSFENGGCHYHAPSGSKCVIGAMLTPSQAAACEGVNVGGPTFAEKAYAGEKLDLLIALQRAHDDSSRASKGKPAQFIRAFESAMAAIAEKGGLAYSAPAASAPSE